MFDKCIPPQRSASVSRDGQTVSLFFDLKDRSAIKTRMCHSVNRLSARTTIGTIEKISATVAALCLGGECGLCCNAYWLPGYRLAARQKAGYRVTVNACAAVTNLDGRNLAGSDPAMYLGN